MAVLLIKSSDIPKNTMIGGNVDVDKYIPCIKDAQITVLEPFLGSTLYRKISADFEAGTLTGQYETLVTDYIQPILRFSAAAEYIVIAAYSITNGGVFKHKPTDSETVSKSEVDFLSQNHRSKAQVYLERCERFLCDGEFPEYNTQENDYDVRKRDLNYMGGWKLQGKSSYEDYLRYKNLEL